MMRPEYKQYLYDLFMKETDGVLHPKKATIVKLHSEGDLSIAYIRKELDLMGIEYEDHITDTRALKRATAIVLHTVATIMHRHHVSFDDAMTPQYHEERWDLLLKNGAESGHKNQLLGMTKEQLVDGVL
ncbi:putative uncharacterised protein [Salmonella phage Vi01]|uniref:Uncharacterized protein n=4 Tax=Kuttervirus TaxID=2169536 RepID=E1XTK9_BPSAV|nr:putative uncharacterised protein [Salmonella phage Vi01]YP_009021369.1 hypothetical protein DF52_gp123 [Salmonella phage vB-SalM-SJ2]YP_009101485.1 hypothetical protein PI33_gp089 [Escherichia phage ECML-4]AGF88481.1 hypothetical protein SP063_00140 [Salmonella phage FSL SP-063]AYC62458.1 hypothetical protein vBEcoMSa157lw_00169 [Escherichia phage vB_EcoM_Sa157lw]UCR91018.1 hypothetical protein Sa157lw_00069 [Escherichia phage Sa157lw]AFO10324.1 hypothetical protein [Escherichia phage ECML